MTFSSPTTLRNAGFVLQHKESLLSQEVRLKRLKAELYDIPIPAKAPFIKILIIKILPLLFVLGVFTALFAVAIKKVLCGHV
jgi:hypothetical protein